MLQLFRTKLAFIPIIFILIFMVFLRVNVVVNRYYQDFWSGDLAPFSKFLYYIFGSALFQSIWFHLILSLILVFLQSGIIISIVSNYKTKELSGFLIAWIYVMLMHLFPAFVFLSPQLIAFTFILLAYRSLLFIEEKRNKVKLVFNSGILIGIASSFWTPSLIFLLLAIYIIMHSNSLNLKLLLSLFISFLIPYFYSATYFLFSNQKIDLTQGLSFNQFNFDFYGQNQLLSLSVLVLILIFSLKFIFQYLSKQLKEIKDFFNSVFFFVFCAFLMFFIQNENNVNVMMFINFPASLFLCILFNRIKRNFLAESIHLILLLSIVVNFLYFIK